MAEQQTTEGRRKERVGVVVSDKMDKTVVVAVDSFRRHRIYKKVLRRTARYKAHDEANEASVGDLVRIRESRPLSRLKRWRVIEIVQRHEVAETKPSDIDQTVVEELERRRKERADQTTTVEQAAAQLVEETAEVPEIEEVAAQPEARAEEPPAEVPVEKAESSEEPVEGGALDGDAAPRRRRTSAAAPAEGSVEAVQESTPPSEQPTAEQSDEEASSE